MNRISNLIKINELLIYDISYHIFILLKSFLSSNAHPFPHSITISLIQLIKGSILRKHCPLKLFVTIAVPKFPYAFVERVKSYSKIHHSTFQTIPHGLTFNKRLESAFTKGEKKKINVKPS